MAYKWTKVELLLFRSKTNSSQVADTYRIGLELLNRPDVGPYLVELGTRCVQAWNDPDNAKKYKNYQWPGNISNMRDYVRRFLAGVRKSPPRIIVDSSLGNVFANTCKDTNAGYNGNLENFRPQDLVHFEINSKVCESPRDELTPFSSQSTLTSFHDAILASGIPEEE